MSRQDRITALLTQRLAPTFLDVVDESSKHAGHAGARPEGETHYKVIIASAAFEGKNHVACHRLINEALQNEFDAGLHALSIKLKK